MAGNIDTLQNTQLLHTIIENVVLDVYNVQTPLGNAKCFRTPLVTLASDLTVVNSIIASINNLEPKFVKAGYNFRDKTHAGFRLRC